MKIFVGIIVLVVLLYAVANTRDKTTTEAPPVRRELTADEKARKAEMDAKKREEDAQWTREVLSLRMLRKAMKNPDSFKLEEAVRMADGALCVTYRGTNSFNAVVPGRAVVLKTGIASSDDRDGFPKIWNKHCAGKSGSDVSYIRQAI